jgi:hypothetical protein
MKSVNLPKIDKDNKWKIWKTNKSRTLAEALEYYTRVKLPYAVKYDPYVPSSWKYVSYTYYPIMWHGKRVLSNNSNTIGRNITLEEYKAHWDQSKTRRVKIGNYYYVIEK